MDDDARPLLEHRRKECAIKADGGEQVGVDRVLPIVVAESQHAAARRRRAADIVDEDVHAAEAVHYLPDHSIHTSASTDVGLDEQLHRLTFRQWRTCGGRHRRAAGREAPHDCLAHALRAASNKGPLAGKFGWIERSFWNPWLR
jgi:hypothetical protein